MLDDLRREDTAERAVRNRLEICEPFRLLDGDTLTARQRNHVHVGVDPARLDARIPQKREELAAPAADVEDRRGVAEVFDVDALTRTHIRR